MMQAAKPIPSTEVTFDEGKMQRIARKFNGRFQVLFPYGSYRRCMATLVPKETLRYTAIAIAIYLSYKATILTSKGLFYSGLSLGHYMRGCVTYNDHNQDSYAGEFFLGAATIFVVFCLCVGAFYKTCERYDTWQGEQQVQKQLLALEEGTAVAKIL